MKNSSLNRLIAALTLLSALAACTRHDTTRNCISRRTPLSNDLLIRQSAADSVYGFLQKNNLPAAEIQPWQVIDHDLSLSTTIGGAYNGPACQVFFYRYIYGLPVWTNSQPSYIFDSTGLLIPFPMDGGYQGPLPGTDTSGHQSLAFLRDRFIRAYNDAQFHKGIFANLYADSCLVAVLGYLDAAYVPGSGILQNKQLIKTWMVTPADDLLGPISTGPIVYVVDSTGETIFNDRRAFE